MVFIQILEFMVVNITSFTIEAPKYFKVGLNEQRWRQGQKSGTELDTKWAYSILLTFPSQAETTVRHLCLNSNMVNTLQDWCRLIVLLVTARMQLVSINIYLLWLTESTAELISQGNVIVFSAQTGSLLHLASSKNWGN